jgi:hypothetical protein
MQIKQYLIATSLLMLSANAQAATIANVDGINAFADTITGSSGSFLNWESVTADDTVDLDKIRSDLTDTVNENTYVFSIDPVASIDFAFSSSTIVNGEGADLVLFFVGNTFTFDFDADAGGTGAAINYGVTDTGFGVTDIFGETFSLTSAMIDLDDFGYAQNQQLGDFRVILGDDLGRPAISLIGGFNTEAMVVPLPLPIILFASGLSVLGFFTRRRKV